MTGGVIEQPTQQPAEGPVAIVGRYSDELLAIAGVEGLGLTKGADGGDAIVVYVRDRSATAKIPSVLGGLPTTVEVTGRIDALDQP